jgi:hypothetical protein
VAVAAVILTPSDGKPLDIKSDAFLTASAGDRFEAHATFVADGGFYIRESGVVEIISASADHVKGRFRFRFEESGQGPFPGSDITADGGFHALLDNG